MAHKRWGIWKWGRCAVSNLSHISTEEFASAIDLSAFFFFLLLLAVFGILTVNGANQKLCIKEILVRFPPLIGFEATKTLNKKQKLSNRFSSEVRKYISSSPLSLTTKPWSTLTDPEEQRKMNSNKNIRPQFGHKHVYASFFCFYPHQLSTVINKIKKSLFSTFKVDWFYKFSKLPIISDVVLSCHLEKV